MKSSVFQLQVRTSQRVELRSITAPVRDLVRDSGVRGGLCVVYVPHTTAGVTINEDADPDVATDLEKALGRLAPLEGDYRHAEGNSDAHVKASLMGSSATVIIEEGDLLLGRWQGIFFCEFDGPRTRAVQVKLLSDE